MSGVVIYHKADFDGIFCREIAKRFLHRPQLIGWDYGDAVPEIAPGSELYMLDISVEGLMDFPGLVWIDHHKSAIDKFPSGIAGYRIDGVAACRLAYQYFHLSQGGSFLNFPMKEEFVDRQVLEPWAVRLAGEYDIWDKRDGDAELFQHGLRSRELSDSDWYLLLTCDQEATIAEVEQLIDVGHQDLLSPNGTLRNPTVLGLLQNGRVLQYAQEQQNASIIRALGFTLEFEGLRFLACNHARFNSLLFTAGLTPEHDACFGFRWDRRQWTVSLYHAPGKEHHDLSLIAVKYGGGGHRGACGFRTSHLPFLPS